MASASPSVNGSAGSGYLVELDGGTRWSADVVPASSADADRFGDLVIENAFYLDRLKKQALEVEDDREGPATVATAKQSWVMLPRAEYTACIHYAWTFELRGVFVSLHRSPETISPSLRVRMTAEAMRTFSLQEVDALVADLLAVFGYRFENQKISRLDVNLTTNRKDWQISVLSPLVESGAYVSRFKRFRRDGTASRVNHALTFGAYPNTEFQIYDKTAELEALIASGNEADRVRGAAKLAQLRAVLPHGRLTRYEWRFTREDLRDNGVNSTADVLAKLPALVPACMTRRVRFLSQAPTLGNSARTKDSPVWLDVVAAFREGLSCMCSGLPPVPVDVPDVRDLMRRERPRAVMMKTAAAYLYKVMALENDENAAPFVDSADFLNGYGRELFELVGRRLAEDSTPSAVAARLTSEQKDWDRVRGWSEFVAFEETDEHLGAPAADQVTPLEFAAIQGEATAEPGGGLPSPDRQLGQKTTQPPEERSDDKVLADFERAAALDFDDLALDNDSDVSDVFCRLDDSDVSSSDVFCRSCGYAFDPRRSDGLCPSCGYAFDSSSSDVVCPSCGNAFDPLRFDGLCPSCGYAFDPCNDDDLALRSDEDDDDDLALRPDEDDDEEDNGAGSFGGYSINPGWF